MQTYEQINNCIVTYSRVLFTMELYCTPKSQHTTVKHSQQLFEHTYRSNLYGLGTLTQSSNQKESVAKHTRASTRGDFQTRTAQQINPNPVTIETFAQLNNVTRQECPHSILIVAKCPMYIVTYATMVYSALLCDRAPMSHHQGNLRCNSIFVYECLCLFTIKSNSSASNLNGEGC
jgi:hypothetical protein